MRETLAVREGIAKLASEGRVVHGKPRSAHVAPETLPDISESEFQRQVVFYARRQGWLVFHVYDSRKSEAGWVDITAVRTEPAGHVRMVVAELKTTKGRLTAAQQTWGELLALVGGNVEYHVWRPEMWPSIMETLT